MKRRGSHELRQVEAGHWACVHCRLECAELDYAQYHDCTHAREHSAETVAGSIVDPFDRAKACRLSE
jgi:ribosomal protein L37AE/L43A